MVSLRDFTLGVVDKAAKPRGPTATSVPGLINLLQSEWDGLMLEVSTLKEHLNTTRQELTQTLYQYEAACRVVARLMKERDQARKELARLKELAHEEKPVSEPDKGITQALADKFNELSEALSDARKTRKAPEDLFKEAKMAEFKESASANIAGEETGKKAQIVCLELTHKNNDLVLAGQKSGRAVLYDFAAGKTVAEFTEHTKKITSVTFVPGDMMTAILCSADSTGSYGSPLSRTIGYGNWTRRTSTRRSCCTRSRATISPSRRARCTRTQTTACSPPRTARGVCTTSRRLRWSSGSRRPVGSLSSTFSRLSA